MGLDRHSWRILNGHGSAILWLTGLPAAGKSTLARTLEAALRDLLVRSVVLDGDELRLGLNKDLGFAPADRSENIRRAGEVARLFIDSGLFVIAAFVSPYQKDRDAVRGLVKPGEFVEIHVRCDLQTCQARDPKGLYRRARQGELLHLTGMDAPYEEPACPELIVDTQHQDEQASTQAILDYLKNHFSIGGSPELWSTS